MQGKVGGGLGPRKAGAQLVNVGDVGLLVEARRGRMVAGAVARQGVAVTVDCVAPDAVAVEPRPDAVAVEALGLGARRWRLGPG